MIDKDIIKRVLLYGCKAESNAFFDVTELKGKVKTKDFTTGCIRRCVAKEPELAGKVYGCLNHKYFIK